MTVAVSVDGGVLSRRRVVAVVARLVSGLEQVGSGYLIDDRRVLTAEHCTRDKATGATPVSLSVVRSFDGQSASVKVSAPSSSGEPSGLDVAVLHLDHPPWAEGLKPPVFAAVNRDQPGELRDCVCIGYPLFQFDIGSGVRKTAEMHGPIRQTDEAEIGQLLFRDLGLIDVTVPAGVAHQENLTAWGGLSGALVFYRDQAIGMVIEHHPHQGGSAVRLMAFDQILTRASANAHAAQLAAELGLSPNRPLVVVSAAPELVELAPPLALLNRDPVIAVPQLPAGTVERVALTEQVVRRLTRQDPIDGVTGPVVGIATALHGAGGFGKTRLATLVCHNADVRAYYRDGIVWVTLGEDVTGPELAGKVDDLCWQLTGVRPTLTDPTAAGAELGRALNGRRLLLVIDDVWSRVQLQPFMNGGPNVTRLVTTRQRTALAADANAIDVDAMNGLEARQLLTASLGPVPQVLVQQLLTATGRWPVLLSLVHGAARADVAAGGSAADSLTDTLQQLVAHGPAVLDVADPDQRSAAVSATLTASLNRLTSDQGDRYGELAVFPEDIDIPRSVLERYWAGTAGWTPFQVHQFCRQLADLSLVQEYRLDPPRLRVHDVIRAYLRGQAGSDLPRRHAALLNANRPLTHPATAGTAADCGSSTDWSRLPNEERYLWSWTGYHLHHAGLDDELAGCLHTGGYVAGKLNRVGPGVLETELGYLEDPVSVELCTAIRQAAHLLGPLEPPGSLEATLASRLADHPALDAIAADLLDLIHGCHLEASPPLPDAPATALRRVLTGHTGGVRALAAAPDGSWLASADQDGTVRIWDPATGTVTHTLTGHTGGVLALPAAPDGSWLASAGNDRTVRIWELSRIPAAALRVDGALTAVCVTRGALVAAGDHGPYWLRIKRIGAPGS
ncbi:MAG TPA: NB-ARC domain-containing protein [Nakamurella sp.]|nr:NB-ARC domain-containing protein [Nakamurella sp.]